MNYEAIIHKYQQLLADAQLSMIQAQVAADAATATVADLQARIDEMSRESDSDSKDVPVITSLPEG